MLIYDLVSSLASPGGMVAATNVSWQEAVGHGFLVDVTDMATECNWTTHVAFSRQAYERCLAWTENDSAKQIEQEELERLQHILNVLSFFMYMKMAERKKQYTLAFYHVPRDGHSVELEKTSLKAAISVCGRLGPVIVLTETDEHIEFV